MTHEKRMKCPMNYPVMCANPNYYYKDYCCEKDEADCNEKGGVRSCNNPGSCMSPSGENDRFQLKILINLHRTQLFPVMYHLPT